MTPMHSNLSSFIKTSNFHDSVDPAIAVPRWTFSDTDKSTRCMPLPKDCGKAGIPCCPGNAAKPFTDPKVTPKPTCSDGSYCFYTPTPDASGWSAPAFASPAGSLLGEHTVWMLHCGNIACFGANDRLSGQPPNPSTITAGFHRGF
jgi:hypothetical protein